ncbi:hypothetical protein [Schlesneria sp.]|uniref:hypothetical protein n=1 Tax=Schlesneria sp. TaxID=2762018 RepID=UPI002EE0ACF3
MVQIIFPKSSPDGPAAEKPNRHLSGRFSNARTNVTPDHSDGNDRPNRAMRPMGKVQVVGEVSDVTQLHPV